MTKLIKSRITLLIIILFMMIFNSISLIHNIEEYFWGGSNYIFADIFILQRFYSFLITFLFFVIYFISRITKRRMYPFLIIVFLFWALSGRVVGIRMSDNNCKIISGWFYIGLNSTTNTKLANIYRLNNGLTVKYLDLWRISIKDDDFNEIIFIGPLLWNEIKETIPATADPSLQRTNE